MKNDPYFMLIKPENDTRRYCGRCELPGKICACDEAEQYDNNHPFIQEPNNA